MSAEVEQKRAAVKKAEIAFREAIQRDFRWTNFKGSKEQVLFLQATKQFEKTRHAALSFEEAKRAKLDLEMGSHREFFLCSLWEVGAGQLLEACDASFSGPESLVAQAAQRLRQAREELANSEASTGIVRVIIFGNPGSGKSALANCLAGAEPALFEAMLGQGEGVTLKMERKTHSGTEYINVPGLSDVSRRKTAAEASTAALRLGGECKILFVFTEIQGRLRGEDVTTMNLILSATAGEVAKDSYGIVINQCRASVQALLKDPEWKAGFEKFIAAGVQQSTSHISYLPMIDALDGAHNKVVTLKDVYGRDFREFVSNFPSVSLTPNKALPVDPDAWNEEEKRVSKARMLAGSELAAMMEEAQRNVMERMQKEMKEQEEREKKKLQQREAEIREEYEKKKKAQEAEERENQAHRANANFLLIGAASFGLISLLLVSIWPWIKIGFYILYTAKRIYDVYTIWKKDEAPIGEDHFTIFGKVFLIGKEYLRVWHVWTVSQICDALVDSTSCVSFLAMATARWVANLFLLTTIMAWILPIPLIVVLVRSCCTEAFDNNAAGKALKPCVVKIKGYFDKVVVLKLCLEDSPQTFATMWRFFSNEGLGATPMSVGFSTIFAILGCAEGVGNIIARLRDAEASNLPQPRLRDAEVPNLRQPLIE